MGSGNQAIDWSKAGKRLRHTPRTPAMGGNNPDWNWVAKRWKTAAEYAGEELTSEQVRASVACPRGGCEAPRGRDCRDARDVVMFDSPHNERRVAAGQARVDAGEFAL